MLHLNLLNEHILITVFLSSHGAIYKSTVKKKNFVIDQDLYFLKFLVMSLGTCLLPKHEISYFVYAIVQ